MENLQLSNFQEIIDNDIEILFSELSSITVDKISLLVTIATLSFSGYYSNLGKSFPGWIPICLIVIITWSINEISTKYYNFESSQFSQESIQSLKSVNDIEKKIMIYSLDLRCKFSLIKPFLESLTVIVMIYYLIMCYYFVQMDLTLFENKTGIFLTSVIFVMAEVFLVELIFPETHIMKFCLENLENPSFIKKIVDFIIEKFLISGLKIQVYTLPILLIYLMFANQINQNLIESLNNPLFAIFLISQFLLWLMLWNVFAIDEVKNNLKMKIKWMISLKKEIFEQRINVDNPPIVSQSTIEKYQLANIFSYETYSFLFFFSDFSINYNLNLALKSQNELIRNFLKMRV
ncbi:MAG: hypothetical protein WC593_05670 [Methanoregula sp.]